MDLATIKEERIAGTIHSYDLHSNIRIDDETWSKMDEILTNLLDNLIKEKDALTELHVKRLFAKTVSEWENVLRAKPLNDCGVYEYGGLNCFFAEIMEALQLPVKKCKYCWVSNFV